MIILSWMTQGRGAHKYAKKLTIALLAVNLDVIFGNKLVGLGHGGLGFKTILAFSQRHQFLDPQHELVMLTGGILPQAVVEGYIIFGSNRIDAQQITRLLE